MSAPRVTGVLEVDLSRHVDRGGNIHNDARATVHRVLVTCPAGVALRVRLGRASWVADGVIDLVAELVADAASVEVVGADDTGPGYVVPRLRERLGVVT